MADNQLKKQFQIRAYAGLNDFLPANIRQRTFNISFKTPIIIAEVLESIGIPRSEVSMILINDEPKDFTYKMNENDRLAVYPAFERFIISSYTETLSDFPCFILDAHLGKLAKYLRMLGFDTLYQNDFDDQYIIVTAEKDNRIILTRDKLLLGSKKIKHGYYVRAIEKHEQLREIVKKFNLTQKFRSFTRCMTCNSELQLKSKKEVVNLIDNEILEIFNEFFYCSQCKKIFWKGSHFENMEKMIISLFAK